MSLHYKIDEESNYTNNKTYRIQLNLLRVLSCHNNKTVNNYSLLGCYNV